MGGGLVKKLLWMYLFTRYLALSGGQGEVQGRRAATETGAEQNGRSGRCLGALNGVSRVVSTHGGSRTTAGRRADGALLSSGRACLSSSHVTARNRASRRATSGGAKNKSRRGRSREEEEATSVTPPAWRAAGRRDRARGTTAARTSRRKRDGTDGLAGAGDDRGLGRCRSSELVYEAGQLDNY